MTVSKFIALVMASFLASGLVQAQIGDYQKSADIRSSDLYQVDVFQDLKYGVGKTNYQRLNASGTYDRITEKDLELDLYVPNTPVSIGKRAVIILIASGGRSGCRNAREILLPNGNIDLANGCSQETIVRGGRVDQEGLNFNHLNNRRARDYAERGLVVVSLVTRYRYEHPDLDEDGSNRWFRTSDGRPTGNNPARLLTNLSAHLEFLVTDIKRSVRWLTANADRYNIDPNYIFIDGGSGGAKMASVAAVTNETQLIVDDPSNIDVAFERQNNNWDIRNSTPSIKGAILRSGDLNGLYHMDLMDTMPDNADAFMLWTGTADASIVHGLSEVIEDKCESLGTCSTHLYSLPNRTHGNTGNSTFPHTITNDTTSPNHIYDFIVSTIYRDSLNQPVISISQDQTSFSESSGRAQIRIERSGNTAPEIQVTVTADQMRDVMDENGDGGTFDLLTRFVAKSSNSDGLLTYDESTGYAYEDAFGGNRRPSRDRNLRHTSGRGNGEFTEISSGDSEYHSIDFTGRTQTITIPSGQTRVTFTVDIRDDNLSEDNECFKVRLLNAYGADIGNSMEVITILDDDRVNPRTNAVCANPDFDGQTSSNNNNNNNTNTPQPALRIIPTTANIDEGSSITLTVLSDRDVTEPITVEYQTIAGSATSASGDYTFARNTVVIPAGSDRVNFSVQTRADNVVESDERFSVRLNEITRGDARITSNDTANITILDDTSTPSIRIAPTAANVNEGSNLTLSIRSDENVTENISIEYQTIAGTATSASGDYNFIRNIAVIPAGRDRVNISVQTRDDTIDEANENFTVRLNEVTRGNARITSTDTATVTIIDNDVAEPTVTLSRDFRRVTEGGMFQLTMGVDRVSSQDISVRYQTRRGTARQFDFVERGRIAVIPAGQIGIDLTVETLQDNIDEDDETFTLLLNEVVSGRAEIGTVDSTLVTIVDDEGQAAPTLVSFERETTKPIEEGSSFRLTIVANRNVSQDTPVRYTTRRGEARQFDFIERGRLAVIPAGQNSVDITIETLDDMHVESPEEFRVELLDVESDNAEIGFNDKVDIIIFDNDEFPIISDACKLVLIPMAVGNTITVCM